MARSLGPEMPAGLVAWLSSTGDTGSAGSTGSTADGTALLLLSTDERGWPRQAMISLGEVVALDARCVRLGLWPGSTTVRNMTSDQRATLTTVWEASGVSLRLSVRRRADLALASGDTLACFDGLVEEVTADEVPYAELTSGVTYRLHDPDAVHSRWSQTQAALREVD